MYCLCVAATPTDLRQLNLDQKDLDGEGNANIGHKRSKIIKRQNSAQKGAKIRRHKVKNSTVGTFSSA